MPKKATAKWRWWQQVENCSRFSILKQCRLKFRKRFAFLFFLILGYTKLISCSAGAHPLFWAQGIYIYIYIYIYICCFVLHSALHLVRPHGFDKLISIVSLRLFWDFWRKTKIFAQRILLFILGVTNLTRFTKK